MHRTNPSMVAAAEAGCILASWRAYASGCRSLLASACALLLLAAPAKAAEVVSNLAEPVSGTLDLPQDTLDQYFAELIFTTGSSDTMLNSVTIDFAENDPAARIFVYGTSSTAPDPYPRLFFLTGNSAPTAAGAYTYTASGVTLAANTTYRIRITNANPNGGNGGSGVPVKLRATASTNETGSSGWSIADGSNTGYFTPGVGDGGVQFVTGVVVRFSVDADPTTGPLNRPPVAGTDTVGGRRNTTTELKLSKLLRNDSDPDGDPLSIVAVSATSAQGGTVVLSPTSVAYTPPPDYVGADAFTYDLSDGRGGLATGLVNVTVADTPTTPTNLVSLTIGPGGVTLLAQGIPGIGYRVQSTDSLALPFVDLSGTLVADPFGRLEFTDPRQPSQVSPNRFYRFVAAP
ncbi:MAG: cadherin-like domain-containing protein [Verrucomicrobia bacterium]|nr:cadherin-like domain-containing protein [Verrucomicrobiota bacterium]